jgi:hypothetical protein
MKRNMLSKVRTYLTHRRALGFKLQSEGLRLLDFGRYANRLRHRGPLTTQLAVRWACPSQRIGSIARDAWRSSAVLPSTCC